MSISEKVPAERSSNPLQKYDAVNDTGRAYPTPSQITKLHIYDFDNTIFRSPCPNPNLLHPHTVEKIKSPEIAGGWWGNPLTLRNVGLGWSEERKRKWEGFWNEDLLELIEMSNDENDTLCIVMTGRRWDKFADLISELLESRDVSYDAFILKKDIKENTLRYKNQVIKDILNHYSGIKYVTIYDDRRAQLNGFQKFLNSYTQDERPELVYHLVPVSLKTAFLEPKAERALVEEMVKEYNFLNRNNAIVLKQSIFYTGYVLPVLERKRLLRMLITRFPAVFNEDTFSEMKILLDFIPVSKHILTKINEDELLQYPDMKWQITKIGSLDEYTYALKAIPLTHTECMGDNNEFILPISSNLESYELHTNKYMFIENYKNIEDWEPWDDVGESGILDTEFGRISNFKINEVKGVVNGSANGGGKKRRGKGGK